MSVPFGVELRRVRDEVYSSRNARESKQLLKGVELSLPACAVAGPTSQIFPPSLPS